MWILILIVVFIVLFALFLNNKTKKPPEDLYSKANNDLLIKLNQANEINRNLLIEIEKEKEIKIESFLGKQKPVSLKKWADEHYEDRSELTGEDFYRFKTNKVDSKYLKPQIDLVDKSHDFYGKKVVITGSFNDFPFRNELAHLLWSVGADIDASITKNVDVVIMGDEAGWKKLELIQEFQTKVINQDILLDFFPDYKPKFI